MCSVLSEVSRGELGRANKVEQITWRPALRATTPEQALALRRRALGDMGKAAQAVRRALDLAQ